MKIIRINFFNQKKAFSLVEIALVFFVITAVFFAIVPFLRKQTEAVRWKQRDQDFEKQARNKPVCSCMGLVMDC